MSTPMMYRKKPVVVEAMKLTAGEAHAVYKWIEQNTLGSFEPMDVIEGRKPYPASGVSIDPRDGRLIISTLEGLHWADMGDWIIRGVQGEFYPCKSDIFTATYEPVDAATAAPSGPAFIEQMPPSPETSRRHWSMYCRECGIEEYMADSADDAGLIAHRDEHNARMHAAPSDTDTAQLILNTMLQSENPPNSGALALELASAIAGTPQPVQVEVTDNTKLIDRAREMRMDAEVGTHVERMRILGELANALQASDAALVAALGGGDQ